MYINWNTYLWIVICGGITSFVSAYAIGANDVANAFATSVGSKTLKLWQACCIAAVFEFSGAVALGGEVSKAIAGSIAKLDKFDQEPEVLMYGMLCALVAATFWVLVATYLEMAVSTTHSIVGAVIGFSLCFKGPSSVVWARKKDTFPYYDGVVIIIASWFISPLCAAICAITFFLVVRTLILRRQNSVTLATWALPIIIVITLFINLFFVINKAAKSRVIMSIGKAAWISAAVAGGVGVISCFTLVPYVKWRLRKSKEPAAPEVSATVDDGVPKDLELAGQGAETKEVQATGLKKVWNKALAASTRGLKVDIHQDVDSDVAVHDMHSKAEVFDPDAEYVFQFAQVLSACAVSFAHGANDVANAVGPFASILYVYHYRYIQSSVNMPIWVLAMGGAGIVLGLATYGYNVMRALGVKLSTLTPSRGFCIELSTAFVLSVGSRYGLPLSSTHIQVGGTFAVGLLEGISSGANLKLMGKFFISWVMTLVVAGFISAAVFSQGAYSPSIPMANEIANFEQGIQNETLTALKKLNSTLYATCGVNATRNSSCWTSNAALNKTIQTTYSTCKKYYDKKLGKVMKVQTVAADQWLNNCLNVSESLYRSNSNITITYVVS